jgi:ABC-type cobalamin/Fe3+-siderophores transport system ATPase subunit
MPEGPGGAGSGKTTLIREFARIAQSVYPRLLVAGGQCNAQTGQGDPFRPFRDILGILTGEFEVDWSVGMLNREQALRIWAAIPNIIRAITMDGAYRAFQADAVPRRKWSPRAIRER